MLNESRRTGALTWINRHSLYARLDPLHFGIFLVIYHNDYIRTMTPLICRERGFRREGNFESNPVQYTGLKTDC